MTISSSISKPKRRDYNSQKWAAYIIQEDMLGLVDCKLAAAEEEAQ
jgi:hypothetical protein